MSARTEANERISANVGPLTSDRQRSFRIMELFREIARTETAFYLQFRKLSEIDRDFLQRYYGLPDAQWGVFKVITRHWGVRTA